MKRSCKELGLCQVEAALKFDRPCPQPCTDCDLCVRPIVVDGSTVAVEVVQITEPSHALLYPFAPGVIEHHHARRSNAHRAGTLIAQLAIASAVGGLIVGFAYAKGWL